MRFPVSSAGIRCTAPALRGGASLTIGVLFAALAANVVSVPHACAQGAASSSPAAPPVQAGRLALLPCAISDASMRDLANALDPVVHSQLEAVVGVTAAARLALDLPAMQIALDCVGETPECLRALATQSDTDSLLAPSVQSAGTELVVTLLYFDARGQGDLRSVSRRHPRGAASQRAALDAVPSMLRELFGIPEGAVAAAPTLVPVASEPSAQPEPADQAAIEAQAEPEPNAFPVAPVIVGGVGVVLIGVGTALGLAANSSEEDYAALDPKTRASADQAIDKYEHARTQALLSDVSFGVGAAAIATGVVWLIVELGDNAAPNEAAPAAATSARRGRNRDRPRVALTPRVAPGELGFALHGSL